MCDALGIEDGGSTKAGVIESLVGEEPVTQAASVQADEFAALVDDDSETQREPSVRHEADEAVLVAEVEEYGETAWQANLAYRSSNARVGIYADVANMYRNGGQRMQYDALRQFACRDHAEPVRLNAYVTYDVERASRDAVYREGASSFHSKLRDYGYKVIVKEVKWFRDVSGHRYGKADADLDLAVDALLQSEKLDRVLIASGDGDFVNVVRALQNRGCRVEAVALDNTSLELREEVDLFISGFLIPGLIPITRGGPHRSSWGEVGSRVRGWCYWNEAERGFGYMRFLEKICSGLWHTDARHPDSPYETAYFRNTSLPEEARPSALPNRNFVFEFELAQTEQGFQATDIELVSRLSDRKSPYPAFR